MTEVIKDLQRQERLCQVYKHLFAYYGITSKTDFADALRIQRTALSAAMNGNKAYLTKNLFQKICATFPNVFNLDYLLTGNGHLLKEQVIHDDGTVMSTEQIEPLNLSSVALAAKDETIAAIREQLKAKDELIASLRQQIEILKQSKSNYINNHQLMVNDDDNI